MEYIFLIIAVVIVFASFTNAWRFFEGIPEFVAEFRTKKRKDLKVNWADCGYIRNTDNRPYLWDGFCHLATDEKGIYVASWCMPNMHIPWQKLQKVGSKRYIFKNYHLLSIQGHKIFTWCVPSTIQING